jgi:hypothetical protein
MGPSNHNGKMDHADEQARELDAAMTALIAILDEAIAAVVDPVRPMTERADLMARIGRSFPPTAQPPARLAG